MVGNETELDYQRRLVSELFSALDQRSEKLFAARSMADALADALRREVEAGTVLSEATLAVLDAHSTLWSRVVEK